MCGFVEASSLCLLFQCRTFVVHCFLYESRKLNQQVSAGFNIPCVCVYILHTHQVCEAAHRKTTGSCDKLQQSHPLLVVHLLDKLPTDHSVLKALIKYSMTYLSSLCRDNLICSA